jgi:hypothetical protein
VKFRGPTRQPPAGRRVRQFYTGARHKRTIGGNPDSWGGETPDWVLTRAPHYVHSWHTALAANAMNWRLVSGTAETQGSTLSSWYMNARTKQQGLSRMPGFDTEGAPTAGVLPSVEVRQHSARQTQHTLPFLFLGVAGFTRLSAAMC